ncbi:MAG: sensor histidine kinase [Sarcina sp.]
MKDLVVKYLKEVSFLKKIINFKSRRKTVFFKISLIITGVFLIILALYTTAQVISISVLADKQDKVTLEKSYADMKMDTRVIGHFTSDKEFYNYIYNLAKDNKGRSYRVIYDGKIQYETKFKHWDRIPTQSSNGQEIKKYKIKGSNYMVLNGNINILGKNLEVQILQIDRGIDDVLSGYLSIFIVVAIIGIILSTLAGIIISRNIVLRLKNLSRTMNDVKNSKNLNARIKTSETGDEFDELNDTFNLMMDRVERVFNKQNQFISDASHELRTPLTAIKGHLGVIKRWGKDDKEVLEESLEICLEEIDRLTNMTNSLLTLSREDNKIINVDQIKTIYPKDLIEDLVKQYNVLSSKVKFNLDIDSSFSIRMKKDDLKQLLIIFIDNAIKYNDKKIPIITMEFKRENKKSKIKISDNGIGISKEDLPKILDRFYRVDKVRTSTSKSFGIGLSIAKSIIKNYKGNIDIQSEIRNGTNIKISI